MYSRLIEFFDERKINYYKQFDFWKDFLSGNDVEFDIGDTALTVADNQNPEQENLTTTHDGATPVDPSTAVGEYVQLAIQYTQKSTLTFFEKQWWALSWLRWYLRWSVIFRKHWM